MKLFLNSCVAAGLLFLASRITADSLPKSASTSPEDLTRSGSPNATVDGILDHLWAIFDGATNAVSREVVAEVSDRFRGLQSQCAAEAGQLDQLSSQLVALQTGLGAKLETHSATLASQSENLTSRLDGIEQELSPMSARLSHLSRDQYNQTAELSRVLAELREIRTELRKSPPAPARDCSDLPAGVTSGVHLLQPGLGQQVPAFCDMDTDGGGWTVIQRRADIKPRQDFFLGWQAYKWGFGELDAEFWWGLQHLWKMTSLLDRRYELRVDLEDFEGEKRHAVFQGFRISSEEDKFRLTAVNYTGDAGNSLSGHNGHPFSTKDKDNDSYSGSCAKIFNGAWWYRACHSSNLNGRYLAGQHESYANGVIWSAWRGHHYSLKTVTMKIRPTRKL